MNKDTYVIIPVYNEQNTIADVVSEVMKKFDYVICVNDGSKDESAQQIAKTKAIVVSHAINLGAGAALQTGIDYALQDADARYFISFDADGQHSLADALKMLNFARKNDVDIVLGSRFLGEVKNSSKFKQNFLKLAVLFSNVTTGIKLSDAHNGLRVFNRHVAGNLNITMPDFAHASEIIHKIVDLKFKYVEFPVTITYSDYSKAKGQPWMNAVNIATDMLISKVSKK